MIGILFTSQSARAQLGVACTDSLTGFVRGQGSGPQDGAAALPGATAYVRELGRGVVADAEGRFLVPNVCPGRYNIEFRFIGYATQVRSVGVPLAPDQSMVTMLLPDNINLAEVVVTEHRSEAQQLLQVQTELSGAVLNATRGLSLGESLKAITGLSAIQTGTSISKPVIHGLYSNRIITLNNGIRQEDQQWGSEHAPQIDPFVASRITVIKGAASIRYGSDAIGGVILVEPKAMPTQPGLGGELNAVGATNGRMGVGSAMVEGAFDKKLTGLSWRLQGTLKRAGYGHTPNYYLQNTSYHETSFSGDVHYDRATSGGTHWGVELYYSQFNTRIGLFSGAQVGSLTDFYTAISRPEPLQQPGFSYGIDRPYQTVTHGLLKLRAYARLERLGTFTATVARQQNERQEYDYVSFSRVSSPELYLRLTTHTADLIWEHTPKTNQAGGRFLGSVGVNGITQGNVRQFLFLIPNFRNYGVGGFVIERYANRRWTLEGGLRYDYRWLGAYFLDEPTRTVFTRTNAWRNMTGSVGAAYELQTNLTLTANLSTAWRAPNVADLYSDGLHQSAVAYETGNPNLRPEQAYNGNLVLAYAGRKLTAELGLYNNRIDNYIYLTPDSVPIMRQRGAFPAYSYNQVRAWFRGVDLTLTYKPTSHLSLISKTALLFAHNRQNDGNRGFLVSIPPNRTENSLRYAWADGRGGVSGRYVSVSGLWVARQNRVPPVTSRQEGGRIIFTGDFAPPPPAYFLLGAEAGFSVAVWSLPVQVIVSGTNLMNRVYRDYMNRFRYFADEPGRNLNLKISVPFK